MGYTMLLGMYDAFRRQFFLTDTGQCLLFSAEQCRPLPGDEAAWLRSVC